MADLRVIIFSFNDNERIAVASFLEDLSQPGSVWYRQYGREAIDGTLQNGREIELVHCAILAQGNVVAAAELAGALFSDPRYDLYVFFGCAGTPDPNQVGKSFIVSSVSYASLGSVTHSKTPGRGEAVTLKNKWITNTDPPAAIPLPAVSFRGATAHPPLNLANRSHLEMAHVMATDKVVMVAPSPNAPAPLYSGPSGHVYAPDEWTYAQALAQILEQVGIPILIEMESYGIGRLTNALGIAGRVVVIRVATDDLVGKARSGGPAQATLLMNGRAALAHTIELILESSVP